MKLTYEEVKSRLQELERLPAEPYSPGPVATRYRTDVRAYRMLLDYMAPVSPLRPYQKQLLEEATPAAQDWARASSSDLRLTVNDKVAHAWNCRCLRCLRCMTPPPKPLTITELAPCEAHGSAPCPTCEAIPAREHKLSNFMGIEGNKS